MKIHLLLNILFLIPYINAEGRLDYLHTLYRSFNPYNNPTDHNNYLQKLVNDQYVVNIIGSYVLKDKLSDLDDYLAPRVDKALAECKVRQRPLFVLQNNDSSISHVYGHEKWPIALMVLGTKRSKEEIDFSLYHEIGHIVNGDHSFKNLLLEEYLNYIVPLISGSLTTLGLAKCTHIVPAVGIGLAIGALGKIVAPYIAAYNKRKEEYAADNFAVKKLLQNNNYAAIIATMHHYLWLQENHYGPFSYKDTHPPCRDRVNMILKECKKQGITLDDLLTKHFPDHFRKESKDQLIQYLHNNSIS